MFTSLENPMTSEFASYSKVSTKDIIDDPLSNINISLEDCVQEMPVILTSTDGNETNLKKEESILNKVKFKYNKFKSYLLIQLSRIHIQSSYKYFIGFLLAGAAFFFISFMLVPMFIIMPSKFLSIFSMGNLCIIISFMFYYGSKEFFNFLTDQKRSWIMLIHLVIVFFGLIIGIGKGYILSLFFGFSEIISSIMFILTLLPGGSTGIYFIKSLLIAPVNSVFNKIQEKFFDNKGLPQ